MADARELSPLEQRVLDAIGVDVLRRHFAALAATPLQRERQVPRRRAARTPRAPRPRPAATARRRPPDDAVVDDEGAGRPRRRSA